MTDSRSQSHSPWPGLVAIALLALAVRAPGIPVATETYRTSEAFAGEETENVRISTGMVHKHQILPHAYEYPSLFYEMSAAVEATVGGGWQKSLIAVRSLSIAFGVAAVLLVGWIAFTLGGPWAAYLAALIMALDGTQIEISAMAKPNAAQVAFFSAGVLVLLALARQPRTRVAVLAAALFALAAASKWLGAMGLAGLALAAALTLPATGWSAWLASLPRARASVLALAAPLLVFAAVFLLCVPGVVLSPKEFGFGFAQVFLAQGAHRRPLPFTISLVYLARSLGPLAVAMAAGALVWALARLRRWDGSALANGIVLVTAWALAYGALVLFAFARLPSYVDLWVPPLAVLAGLAWVGDEGWLRRPGARVALLTAVALVGLWAHGADSMARGIWIEGDGRQGAARWLEAHAADTDTVLADEAVFVPDRVRNVWWNWWGEPARVIYDETKTWGTDPVWPSWGGGHRRLVFENAKWAHPESLLTRGPRWVMTTDAWRTARASDSSLASFDRRLDSGEAGYRERARLTPIRSPLSRWALVLGGPRPPALYAGMEIRIYERETGAPAGSGP